MEAKELRIGNLLQYCNQTVHVMCIQTLSDKYDVELGYYVDSVGFQRKLSDKDVKPIPLTEDWLVKLGFKKWNSKGTTYSKGVLILHLRKRGWVVNKRFLEPKYVHQLQNLYFALTNIELEINL